jgi:hypothetical protein
MKNNIPYYVMTSFIDNYDYSEYCYLTFQDKRKASKVYLKNMAQNNIPYSERSKDLIYSFPILRNTGFSLELSEIETRDNVPNLIITHPDLPEEKYKFALSITNLNATRLINLIAQCGMVSNKKLIGTFYYDTETEFFNLDDGTIEKEKSLGKALTGSWRKLIPGHEYYIELHNINHVIYLGYIPTVRLSKCYRRRGYTIDYQDSFDFLSNLSELTLSSAYLFKDLERIEEGYPYFLCNKDKITGIDLGDRGETMDETDFEDLCIKNNWIIGINDKTYKNKCLIDLLSKCVKDHNGVLDSRGILSDSWGIQKLDLNKYNSQEFYDLLNSRRLNNNYFGEITGFTRLFYEKDVLGLTDDQIKEIIDGVFNAL